MEFDIITVQLVPEKKGLFLKHSEYEVRNLVLQWNRNLYYAQIYTYTVCLNVKDHKIRKL